MTHVGFTKICLHEEISEAPYAELSLVTVLFSDIMEEVFQTINFDPKHFLLGFNCQDLKILIGPKSLKNTNDDLRACQWRVELTEEQRRKFKILLPVDSFVFVFLPWYSGDPVLFPGKIQEAFLSTEKEKVS